MRFRSAVRGIAVSAALASGLVAHSASTQATSPDPGATVAEMTVGFAVTVANVDVGQAGSDFGNYVGSLSLEHLLQLGENGELQPWLAEEVTQPSDTVYEYHLREGVRFWNGNELTSADVVNAWEHYRRPESPLSTYYEAVDTIEAVDPYTVRVTLTQPDARWKYTPATAGLIFEKEYFDAHPDDHGQPGVLVMGTGPWVFDSLNPTSGAELSANPDYWGGEVPVEKISVRFFSDENGTALALRAGELDMVPQVQDVPAFEAASGVEVGSAPTCRTGFFSMPTQTPPWDDVHVRRAVAHVINRDDVIAASGFPASPAYTLIAESQLQTLGTEEEVDAALASLPSYELDLEAAQAEMAQSAYPDGFETELITFNYGSFLAVDQVIAAQLAQIGIDVTITDIGQAAWFAAVSGPPDERPLTYTTTGGCNPDPSYYSRFLGSDNLVEGLRNIANWAPPEVDELLAAGLTETDPAERLSIYTQILEHMATDVPYVPLYVNDVSYASTSFDWSAFDGNWYSRVWGLELAPK